MCFLLLHSESALHPHQILRPVHFFLLEGRLYFHPLHHQLKLPVQKLKLLHNHLLLQVLALAH